MKTKMLKRLALALACAVTAPVFSAEWQISAATNSNKAYYFFDHETVSKQGNTVTITDILTKLVVKKLG